MNDIGVIICNYNKEEYVINCIRSVMKSSISNFDVYVVDNASTDNSVERIKEEFGKEVTLIVNKDNLGGSGGFNTGLREALKHDYKYIMLLDNDIEMDKYSIEELYKFMDSHDEVGMVGSKVYFMDYPERIWGYGGNINFKSYRQEDNFKNCTDSESIPEVLYCDYVAACSLMARADAIRKVGLMPEDNFIYWDDMEWGYRFNQAGYKVAVWGKSKVWHKAGGRNAGNTFINYYMWRNRILFFLKVLPIEKRDHFSEMILSDMFQLIYSCNLKSETNIVKSVMFAFDDAIHKVSGKAADYKILPRNGQYDRMEKAIGSAKNVLIKFSGDFEGLGNIIRKVGKIGSVSKITISTIDIKDLTQQVRAQFPSCEVMETYEPFNYDFNMEMCSHIFNADLNANTEVYVDPWCNIINGKEEHAYCENYENTKKIFTLLFKELMLVK
ncbi:glycosyltransferase [Anaerocolumna sedimenticola]|uniref:Glycosyltransferase n=1 Tax=Anaerocolumna sedimenticola TaxID=2696063 RepID=A0A6P1TJR7_9FIRM|nr:glycosyltransferase family 2 protein [Anaerocolumna sedimenticola]QHQ60683.1 glycosyltransferase [Anaerocolumna sedimenticola]